MTNRYAAAVLSILITLAGAVAALNQVTWPIIVQLAILTVTAFTTYLLPLIPQGWAGAAKTGTEVLGAVLTAIVPFVIAGHITGPQIALVLLAALKALGTEVGVQARLTAQPRAVQNFTITNNRVKPGGGGA